MPQPTVSGPSEQDQLLPPQHHSNTQPSRTFYTIRGTPPVPDNDTVLPTTNANGILRLGKRQPGQSLCGKFAKVAFAILTIILVTPLIVMFWERVWHTVHGHSGSEVVLRPLPGCSPLTYTQNSSFSFNDPRNFRLKQFSSDSYHRSFSRIGGRVVVTRAPENQASQIEASVVYGSSDKHVLDFVTFDASSTSLTIDTGNYRSGSIPVGAGLCLSIDIYLSIASDVKLDTFDVDVSHLQVELKQGASLAVAHGSSISSHSGGVMSEDANILDSRRTIVSCDSGSISGKFALLDLLSLNTKSGSIHVDVTPGEASDSSPQPANLVARSMSGSIQINLPTHDLPDRNYMTDVVAASGSVSGVYIHGTRTTLQSYSGTLNAQVTPFDGAAGPTTLSTEAHSGQTSLTLHEPYRNADHALSHLSSRHVAMSGSLNIQYPRQWEGSLEGNVMSGSLKIHGSGLKIIEDTKRGPIHRVKAVKGDGQSQMSFSSTSGSVSITVE